MSSTSLDAPPRRLIIAAIVIVVTLHMLTAIALAAIKTPELKVEAEKNTTPIEIELVTLPTEDPASEVEVTEIAPKEEPKPQAKPVVQPKPKTPVKPVVKEKRVTPKAKPVAPVKKRETKNPLKEPLVDPKIAEEAAANDQRKIIAAQALADAKKAAAAEKAARDAQAQSARDAANAKAARDAADAKATREAAETAARAKDAANAKAAKEAADKAAAAEKAAAAASNTPVPFTASAANWASAPNFSFPDRAARRASSGETFTVVLTLRVNKQGGIDSVSLARSSGNTLLDKEAQRQARSGKFKPFTKNGVPVVGNVTLPIAYKVP